MAILKNNKHIHAFRRALSGNGDHSKRPGVPVHSTRNGCRMAAAG